MAARLLAAVEQVSLVREANLNVSCCAGIHRSCRLLACRSVHGWSTWQALRVECPLRRLACELKCRRGLNEDHWQLTSFCSVDRGRCPLPLCRSMLRMSWRLRRELVSVSFCMNCACRRHASVFVARMDSTACTAV